jgi:RNA polymerase sigma-70 factor, ECF subfamily
MTSLDDSTGDVYDPTALRILIEEHTPRLLRKAIALCGDVDQAEDIVQATWVQVHFKRASFQGRGTFAAWIDAILRHTYINQRRSERRREQYEQDSCAGTDLVYDFSAFAPITATHDSDPDTQVGRLVRAVLTLSPRERQIFVQRAIAGKSVREVAQLLDRAEGTVKSTFAHAVARLRHRLSEGDRSL